MNTYKNFSMTHCIFGYEVNLSKQSKLFNHLGIGAVMGLRFKIDWLNITLMQNVVAILHKMFISKQTL